MNATNHYILRTAQDRAPANDNRPPMREIDRWRLLIDRLKPVSVPLALWATEKKLAGWPFDEFCDYFLLHAKITGWVD